MLWRPIHALAPEQLQGRDDGSGGVALTLVRGTAGAQTAMQTAPSAQEAPAPRQVDTTAATATDAPQDQAHAGSIEASASGAGGKFGPGSVGEAGDGVESASVGSGYDRGKFASLAPLSFSQAADSGLWDKVKPCLKAPLPTPVTLSVVIDGSGGFVDAYQPVDALPTQQPAGTVQAIDAITEALKACGPYRRIVGGPGHPVTMIAAATPGR